MANGTSLIERRMAFLERICQEDRERWNKNDQRLAKLYKMIQESNRRADRRFAEHDRKFEEQGRRTDGLMQQIDTAVKMLRRFLEH